MIQLEIWQAVVLALIQGITEFLPISSAAHLQFPSLLLGWNDQGLHFDVATHGGSLLAVLIYYRHTLQGFLIGSIQSVKTKRMNADTNYLLRLCLATLPVVVIGFTLQEVVADHARSLVIIILASLLFGVLLGVADWSNSRRKVSRSEISLSTMPLRFALYIGCAQIFALIPGTSRSGVTMTCGLFLGLSRKQSAEFAFLLGIPTILGAFLLLLIDATTHASEFNFISMGLGFVVALVSTYLCIDIFLRFIERIGMMPFVIYRVALATVLGMYLWL